MYKKKLHEKRVVEKKNVIWGSKKSKESIKENRII